MQLRRLDPLANAGPYQRLLRNPVKSFSMTEAQYERVRAARPQLFVTEGESAVVGLPLRDCLEVHYAFPDIEAFVDRFPAMLEKASGASNRSEAPRGLVIAFRDRPNRMTADTVFWSLAMDQGEQWVEMSLVAVPETAAPGSDLGDGYRLTEASAADDRAIVELEAAVTGQTPLSPAGVRSLRENAKLLGIVRDGSDAAAGLLVLRTEPSGWGVIDLALLREGATSKRTALIGWAIAWLRNNGGRRVRIRSLVDDTPELSVLRDLGFIAGEAGLYLTRSVDKAEVAAKLAGRKDHGTIIKFGDWR